jgi:hypothetical protein
MALILPIFSKFDNSGLKKAQKEFGAFGGSLRKGLAFAGLAVGLGEIVNVMKESVKAAAMDNKSQKMLALQLMTTVHATKAQTAATEAYLGKLSMSVGIVDDLLRPALANAVRGTGSLAAGQKLLGIALDGAAATGKPLNAVMQALIKASNGQTGALYKLAPQLKATKGNLDDFAASVKGAAQANADPFARMQVAIDELKEKFGRLLLPMVIQFVDYLTKTVVPAVSKFLDQVGNPKTDVGKTFMDIKKAVAATFNGVRDFFALFGGGDAMKGFGNIAQAIIKMLPALLALKGIMMLSSAGSAIQNLVKAVALIRGTGGGDGGGGVIGTGGGGGTGKLSGLKKVGSKLGGSLGRGLVAGGITSALGGDADASGRVGLIAAGSKFGAPGAIAGAILGSLSGDSALGNHTPAWMAASAKMNKTSAAASAAGTYLKPVGGGGFNAQTFGKSKTPTTINVNVQPGTSGPETAKAIVKLLGTFDKINGTNIVTKPGR